MARSIRRRDLLQAAAVATLLSGCTPGPGPKPTPSADSTATPTESFVFATPAAPIGLDPAIVTDIDSLRVTRQVLEGLVATDPETGAPAPALATQWLQSADQLSYTFALRQNVRFHDGTPFTAAAVKANFDRWFSFSPAFRAGHATLPFTAVFKAHSDAPTLSVFKSCEAIGDYQVRIDLTQPLTGFLQALTAPGFGISSPAALAAGAADVEDQASAGTRISRYALHPVGTGPFRFKEWTQDRILLEASPDYWGTRGQISQLSFVAFDQAQSRLQALLEGRIDGYDAVTIDNIETLVRKGLQVVRRDPFSVVYLGMNQAVPILQNEKVRQAISMAVNKDAIIRPLFLEDTKPASQFVPPKLSGFNQAGGFPSYDPEKAKRYLAEAGYKGEELKFCYPLNVTRLYLPSPEKVYAELSAQLTRVGLNIRPVPIDWSDGYLQKVTAAGDHAFHLLGRYGTYSDPDDFLSSLFGAKNGEFGFFDAQLFSKIERARGLPDGADRTQAYQSINSQLGSTAPAVPIAFPISAVAVSSRVESYPTSPVLAETFNRVALKAAPASS
ncbi:ABC transporter substrate-binding protein [Sinomonas sp. JGH33]|uniref:ABC transporter substrate-binding protein n=1 Tax=Sinomonas terricola TaxID=3110330 RepID=A0ABU5TAJ4_9MICC|nr:ABC transporter substrate-binding protein [Sinomonas sp. JGH33]MEA5456608.1 ABC transporter substrate-binding protein [Sinomonas sp. JGH33]